MVSHSGGNVIFRTRFLYLRTRTAFRHASGAMEALHRVQKDQMSLFGFHRADLHQVWEDGIALRLRTNKTPEYIRAEFGSALDEFDMWAIHDGESRCIDAGGGIGPTSHFFDSANRRSDSNCRVVQLFVRYWADDTKVEAILGHLHQVYQDALFKPVFHFKDGRIYLAHTKEPAEVTCRLPFNQAVRRLPGFAVCESDGALSGKASWRSLGSSGSTGRD